MNIGTGLTRTYFQWARGRAMVRSRAMREARFAKRRGDQNSLIGWVKAARKANREAREYRKRYLELKAEDKTP